MAEMLDCFDRNGAEGMPLVAHGKRIEQRVGKLNAKFAQLSLKSDCPSKKPTETCHYNAHLKEAERNQFTTYSYQGLYQLDQRFSKIPLSRKEQIRYDHPQHQY